MAQQHIVTSFEDELKGLSQSIAEMGGHAEQLVDNAITALLRSDSGLAREVIAADREIDMLHRQIEERAILVIARRQPMAMDLRETVAAFRISNDLERIGDLGKNIAKRTVAIQDQTFSHQLRVGVEHLSELGLHQLKNVLDAYGTRDAEKAREVCARDEEIDAVYTSLFRQLLTYMMEDPRNISMCIHLLFCAKNIERIGDHATNIAETVYYIATGEQLGEPRPVEHPRLIAANMARPFILVVEDEEPLVLLLRYNLEAEGYEVDSAGRGDEAEVKLRERVPDLLILDWMLPALSGIELCRRLRARAETAATPVIMLTARGEEDERVRGLATGADDYIVKPFSVAELLARVKALLRRAKPETVSLVLRAADLELDREMFRVRRGGREVHLGPTEFRLLEFLMKTPGRVFSREQLLDGVWGRDVYVDERTVDVHIGRLRRALNRGRARDPIRTVRRAGYAFDEQFQRA